MVLKIKLALPLCLKIHPKHLLSCFLGIVVGDGFWAIIQAASLVFPPWYFISDVVIGEPVLAYALAHYPPLK